MRKYLSVLLVVALASVASAQWLGGVTMSSNMPVLAGTEGLAVHGMAVPGNFEEQAGEWVHVCTNYGGDVALVGGVWMYDHTPGTPHYYTGTAWEPLNAYIDFDLGGAVALDTMSVWNCAQPGGAGELTRTMKKIDISYSTDGVNYTPMQTVILNSPFEQYPGLASGDFYGVSNVVDMQGVTATNVRFGLYAPWQDGAYNDVPGALDGSNPWIYPVYWGLGEVAFTEVPEPATMVLLGLGGLAALRRRR